MGKPALGPGDALSIDQAYSKRPVEVNGGLKAAKPPSPIDIESKGFKIRRRPARGKPMRISWAVRRIQTVPADDRIPKSFHFSSCLVVPEDDLFIYADEAD